MERMDERELCRRMVDYLNGQTMSKFDLEFVDSFCDIIDRKNNIYIEVKPDHFAPAQILHAMAKQGIKDAKYIGVADGQLLKLYKPPKFECIKAFAESFDRQLAFTSSDFDKTAQNERADEILGEPNDIISLQGIYTEGFNYITKNNLRKKFKPMLDKYKMEPNLLVEWLDGVSEDDELKVNKKGWLINMQTGQFFMNEHSKERQVGEVDAGIQRKPNYRPIRDKDATFFESLRIHHNDLGDILHEADRFLSIQRRRNKGVFWTEKEVGNKMADEILKITDAQYVVEPCVGGGSLIEGMKGKVVGAFNDIEPVHVEGVKQIMDMMGWKGTSYDIIATQTSDLLKSWAVPDDKTLLVYSNPPFGTSSSNSWASKAEELGERRSRRSKIEYSPDLVKYGKGDLMLPLIGKFIEICKSHPNSYLAFYAPLGLFCGRKRYIKLYNALARDFKFLKGYLFAGDKFHDIKKTKPIALTIWKYSPNSNTQNTDLTVEILGQDTNNSEMRFKRMLLLKDGWRYRDGSKYVKRKHEDRIGVARCDYFNCPTIKTISDTIADGSNAEIAPENVKVSLNITSVPSELAYALWSTAVGIRSFGKSTSTALHPLSFDNAYVHMPDFTMKETFEILAYSALYNTVYNYAEGIIGFLGVNKVFKFGNAKLTEGVMHLLDQAKDCVVYDGHTISETLELIKEGAVNRSEFTKGIIYEVYQRLDAIGYWNYIPLPLYENQSQTKLTV